MSSLRDIRRKLRSIENIKKITDAMERVAAVHLKRAQVKAEESSVYVEKIKNILADLANEDVKHPLFEERKGAKIALVIIGSDKGLCGSHNANLFSAVEKFLKNYSKEQVELFLFGRKTIAYFAKSKWKVGIKKGDWTGKITYNEIEEFSNKLVTSYLNNEFDKVFIAFTHYISVMNRQVEIKKFLNVEKIEKSEEKNINFILEPNLEEILAKLIPRYCMTSLEVAFAESYAAELAARIIAMQAASKNSEELIENLTRTKNKIRQRDITREMIEITSGAEGLK